MGKNISFQCDRCGTEDNAQSPSVTNCGQYPHNWVRVTAYQQEAPGNDPNVTGVYDLCPSCAIALNSLFRTAQ